MEKLSDRARKVMQFANQQAQRFDHEFLLTEHILLGIVQEGSGVGATILRELGVSMDAVRSEMEKLMVRGPEMVLTGKIPLTPQAKKVIESAKEQAREGNHEWVDTEHLLLGILREREGSAAQMLERLVEMVREQIKKPITVP